MEKELIHLEHVSKTYDGHKVLDGLDLAISENEFVTLLGPSGCGKTTTLRLIAGFETPDEGRILFEGADITQLPPNRRQVNTVFQNYSLFSIWTSPKISPSVRKSTASPATISATRFVMP